MSSSDIGSRIGAAACCSLPAPLVAALLAGISDLSLVDGPCGNRRGRDVACESSGCVGGDDCFVFLDAGDPAGFIAERRSFDRKDTCPSPSFLDDDVFCRFAGRASLVEREISDVSFRSLTTFK